MATPSGGGTLTPLFERASGLEHAGNRQMIPLAIPNLSGNESRYLQECIDTAFVSSVGPFVDRFEHAVAKAAGAAHAVATASGTSGLHAALVAVGVGRDDLVVLPSWTFIASANAIHQCGATPQGNALASDPPRAAFSH